MKIALIRANNYEFESRLKKEHEVARSVAETSIINWDRQGLNNENNSNIHSLHLKASYGKKVIFLLPIWFTYTFIQLVKSKPDIIHACNIESVIPSWVYAGLFRKKLVYDIWDTAGGMFGGNNKKIQSFLNRLEVFFLRRSDYILAPDKERLNQLGCQKDEEILDKFLVVYNSSDIITSGIKKYDFSKYKTVKLSYVGTMLKNGRGIEQLVKAVSINQRYTLDIAGYGPDGEYFKEYFQGNKFPNIKYHGRVSHEIAENLNNEADIMVSLLDSEFDNYRFATSTKIFEAFSANKPVITTKKTASGKLVQETEWGSVIDFNQKSLDDLLSDIALGKVKFNLDSALVQKYSWSHIARQLSKVYISLDLNNKGE